jgi:hypothetical protein
MYDLIAQIENAAAGSITQEVRLLKERRKSLDDVIKLTLGINHLQKSLESILLLKQPAKDIPRDLLNTLGNISDSVANLPPNELSKRLDFLEKSIQKDIDAIMGISNQLEILDPTELGDSESKDTSERLHSLVSDFRRRTNTAIILKLHLRKRGVNVTESVIPVSTDVLVAQVSKLVIEEKKCCARTIKGLTDLNQELEEIIDNPGYADSIKPYALMMRQKINVNIEHLQKGKDIEKMPYVVEIIELGISKKEKDTAVKSKEELKNKKPDSKSSVKKEKSGTKNKKQSSFIKKLFKWLSSPWSVNWRDL